jgi:group I intron endonuclease
MMIGVIFHMNSNFKRFWPRTNGIYKITNRKTGRFYIGRAEGKTGFYTRWLRHRLQLRKNIHENSYFQNSYNKHGEDCFTFEILEIKDFGEPLVDLESEYIINLGAMYFEKGFNIKNEKSASKLPSIVRENHHKAIEFEILDLKGNLVKGKNLSKFCEELDLEVSNIFNVIKGIVKSCKGYKSVNPEFNLLKGCYRLLSPTKELIIFDNMREFATKIGVNKVSIQAVLSGKTAHIKGYHLESPSPKHQKNLDRFFNKKLLVNRSLGIIVRFLSMRAFCIKYKVSDASLASFLAGKGSQLMKNYNWITPTEEDMELYTIIEETF